MRFSETHFKDKKNKNCMKLGKAHKISISAADFFRTLRTLLGLTFAFLSDPNMSFRRVTTKASVDPGVKHPRTATSSTVKHYSVTVTVA